MQKKILLFTLLFSFAFAAGDEEIAPPLEEKEEVIAAVNNLGPNAGGYSTPGEFGPEDSEFVDPKVLRDFIESRSLIECRQKEGTLTLAGDVRARWIVTGEEVDGLKVRGQGTETALNLFRSEFNLFLDYVAPKGWVSTKVKWSVFDGVDGGSATRVELDRAFIGYDIYECECEDFYIEVGRSKLDYMFESRVEFSSFFDGVHLYYTNEWENVGVFTLHGGPFVIDSYSNHFGFVMETGCKRLGGTGFSVKYSVIDWSRTASTLNYGNRQQAGIIPGTIYLTDNPRYRFLVSQVLFGHEKPIDLPGCQTLYLYAAVLANHKAKKNFTTDFTYANKAFYIGFTLGKLCKAFDWSIDINYQYVQAQAVPEFDLSGIGHGNALNNLLSDAIIVARAPFEARGFTNYKGFTAQVLYALTDSLSLRAKADGSVPINKKIGGDFLYKNFEMAVIYAF